MNSKEIEKMQKVFIYALLFVFAIYVGIAILDEIL